jgi:hypothetical protein
MQLRGPTFATPHVLIWVLKSARLGSGLTGSDPCTHYGGSLCPLQWSCVRSQTETHAARAERPGATLRSYTATEGDGRPGSKMSAGHRPPAVRERQPRPTPGRALSVQRRLARCSFAACNMVPHAGRCGGRPAWVGLCRPFCARLSLGRIRAVLHRKQSRMIAGHARGRFPMTPSLKAGGRAALFQHRSPPVVCLCTQHAPYDARRLIL